jgi:hypothetical protein
MIRRFRQSQEIRDAKEFQHDWKFNHLILSHPNVDVTSCNLEFVDQIQCKEPLANVPTYFYPIGTQHTMHTYQRALVSVVLEGGLGNRLFQLAAGLWYSCKCEKTFVISLNNVLKNPHSQIDYNNQTFTGFPIMDTFPSASHKIMEEPHNYSQFIDYEMRQGHILLKGYFQSYKYIPSNFSEYLTLPKIEPTIKNITYSSFLHVRRGDFVSNPVHNVSLQNYFLECLRQSQDCLKGQSKDNKQMVVISDDVKWCQKQPMFTECKTDLHFANELETLAFMKNCNGIAICSNSTFSWWGSFLSSCSKIYLPEPWLKDSKWATQFKFSPERVITITNDTWFLPTYVIGNVVYDTLFPSHVITCKDLTNAIQLFLENSFFYGLFIVHSCKLSDRASKKIELLFNEHLPFEIVHLGAKGKVTTEFIKSPTCFRVKYISQSLGFILTQQSARSLRDINQFHHAYLLKDNCLQ